LALSILLAQQGADVSIVARNENNLKAAIEKLEAVRQSHDQKFAYYSYSLTSAKESQEALQAVIAGHNEEVPDAVFLCAGGSKPKFFVEMSEEELVQGMDMGYWVQAWTAWAATKEMTKKRKKGKICFVSSTLGYMSLIGYASYSPAKHALRGLADTLRFELQLYNIDVQIFFPCTMFTPGYEEENKTKPGITLKLEEDDAGLTAEQAAQSMLTGIKNHHSHITGDWITAVFRASTKGASPGRFFLKDWALNIFGGIALPIWRMYVDKKIVAHTAEHKTYLEERDPHS